MKFVSALIIYAFATSALAQSTRSQYLHSATVKTQKGDLGGAIKDLDKAIQESPKDANAY